MGLAGAGVSGAAKAGRRPITQLTSQRKRRELAVDAERQRILEPICKQLDEFRDEVLRRMNLVILELHGLENLVLGTAHTHPEPRIHVVGGVPVHPPVMVGQEDLDLSIAHVRLAARQAFEAEQAKAGAQTEAAQPEVPAQSDAATGS